MEKSRVKNSHTTPEEEEEGEKGLSAQIPRVNRCDSGAVTD